MSNILRIPRLRQTHPVASRYRLLKKIASLERDTLNQVKRISPALDRNREPCSLILRQNPRNYLESLVR